MIVVAIVLVLLALIILSLPFLLDLNRYRDQYLPILEQALDRHIEVEDVRLTLFPTLGVQLREVAIADDPAFTSKPFLMVPSVQVVVEWRPLLQRRIEVQRILVERPIVQVIRSIKGDLNISTMGKIPTSGQVASKSADPKDSVSPLLGVLAVKQFSVIGGTLQFEDRMPLHPKRYQIENMTLNTESVGIGKTAQVRIHGMVMPYQIPFDVKGRFGPVQENLDISELAIDGLVGKVAVTAKGKMVDGQLTADVQIPKASTEDIPIELGLNKPVRLSQLQAHVVASIFSKGPRVLSHEVLVDPLRMNLHVGQSIIHVTGKGSPSRFSLVGDSPTFLSQDFPVFLPVQRPFALEQLEFAAEIQGETLEVQSFKAKAFDGTLSAKGVLGIVNLPLTFSTQGAFSNFSTEKLMKTMRPSSLSMTGVGELKWKVSGIVPSLARPEFDGPLHLTIRDGAIVGFDLVKAVEDGLKMPGLLGKITGVTTFSLIDAKTELEKDGLSIRELQANVSNFLLRSAGKVGLDQTVNLQGTLNVPSAIAEKIIQRFPMAKVVRQEGQYVLPFIVQGTVQNAKFRLDTKLLGKQVQKKIEKRLEKVLQGDDQELQKLLDEGKDLLKQFFRK